MMQTRMRPLAALAFVALLAARTANGRAGEPAAGLHERAVRSAGWVATDKKSGAACLIDRENRLLLTNYHVVEENDDVLVAFPVYDGQGRLTADRQYYWDNFWRLKVKGKVLRRDAAR